MHSRIFELSHEEVNEDERMDSSTFDEDYFVGAVADYVTDDVDRAEDLNWFLESLDPEEGVHYTYDAAHESITFHKGFKEAYFASSFAALKTKLSSMTLPDFTEGMTAYELTELIDDRMDFYLYSHDSGWCSLDTFVRRLAIDETYYFGGIVDYHM